MPGAPLARIEDGVTGFSPVAGLAAVPTGNALPAPPTFKILLVEDHDLSRVTLSRLLTRRGYDVLGAADLAEARSLAAREPVAFVISDLGLPDGRRCGAHP